MDKGRYNFAWNYEERCATMFESFLNIQKREEFSDVTLVTDDDTLVKAHRIVLGACSPFFRSIFSKTNVRDLCLYLPGITCSDLESILDFMYNGQTEIPVDSLETFTKTAAQLRVKGLTSVEENENVQDDDKIIEDESTEFIEESVEKDIVSEGLNLDQVKIEPAEENTTHREVGEEFEQNNAATVEETEYKASPGNETAVAEEIKDYVEKGQKHKCNQCDFICARKDRLKKHIVYAHTSVDFLPCTKCDFVAKENTELKNHIEMKHKKANTVKKSPNVFPCNQCDYRARSLENLEIHTKFIVHKPKIDN